jgi:hypothetical protein
LVTQFARYKDALQQTADFILKKSGTDASCEGAIGFNFLMQMGYVCGAWYHLRSFEIAQAKVESKVGDTQFYANKQLAARFFISQLLPRATAYGDAVIAGADIGCELSAAAFA